MGERYHFEHAHRGRARLTNEFAHFFLSVANSAGRRGLCFVSGRHLRCQSDKDRIRIVECEGTGPGRFADRFLVEKLVRVLLSDSPVLLFEITTNAAHH